MKKFNVLLARFKSALGSEQDKSDKSAEIALSLKDRQVRIRKFKEQFDKDSKSGAKITRKKKFSL